MINLKTANKSKALIWSKDEEIMYFKEQSEYWKTKYEKENIKANWLGWKLEKFWADKLEWENKSLRWSWSRSHTCNSIERMWTPV